MSDLIGKYCVSFNGETYSGEYHSIGEIQQAYHLDYADLKIGKYARRVEWCLFADSIFDEICTNTEENAETTFEDSVADFAKTEGVVEKIQKALDEIFKDIPIEYYEIEKVEKPTEK